MAQLADLKGQSVRVLHHIISLPGGGNTLPLLHCPCRCACACSVLQSKLPGLRTRKAELESDLSAQRGRLTEAEAYCSDMALKMAEKRRELEARGEWAAAPFVCEDRITELASPASPLILSSTPSAEQELSFAREHLGRVQKQVDGQELHLSDVDAIAKKKVRTSERLIRRSLFHTVCELRVALCEAHMSSISFAGHPSPNS